MNKIALNVLVISLIALMCTPCAVFSANTAPKVVSVSPSSGFSVAGLWMNFTCTYSDANGAANLAKVRLTVGTSTACSGAASFLYNRTVNKLYMINNAGGLVGGVVRGTATTIETENAILHCGSTTVTKSGNNLVVSWRVRFKSTMTGKNCNLYMLAQDASSAISGWVDKGNFSLNAAPTAVSVSPSSSSSQAGVWKTFTCTYSDANGATDISNCKLTIGASTASTGAACFLYNRVTNKLCMLNNAGATVGDVVRGTATTIETENAILHCGSTTVTKSGNNLVVSWRVRFKSTMNGKNCNLYMLAQDTSSATSGWVDKGNLTINAAPTAVSVSPNSGTVTSGTWKTFTCAYSDANGATNISSCKLTIGTSTASAGAASFLYNRTTNKLSMLNNAGAAVGDVLRGTATTMETENAILNCGTTTVTTSGNNLVVSWRVRFKSTMDGKNCNLYMLAQDASAASSGWISKGTCNIAGVNANSYIDLGMARINSVVMMEPFNEVTAKTLMQQAKAYFEQAKALQNNNAQANFGLAITDAALTAQSLIDKYQDLIADEGSIPASLKYTVNTLQFMNLPSLVENGAEPLNELASSYTSSVTSPISTTSSVDPQTILGMQADIKNVVRPMLSRVGGYLDIVEANGGASFTFPIGTQAWDGYTIVDLGDVYLFHGALLATRWALAIPASYNVNVGTFNFDAPANVLDTNHDGLLTPSEYLPASPFLNLADSATMIAAKADMTTAADKIIAGINSTLTETTDNYDLIPWHTPDEGPSQAELLMIKDYAADLKASMNAATTFTWEDDEETMSIKVFLGKWNTNPPATLKSMFPTEEICRWRNEWANSYEYWTEVTDGGFPDETLGGMFPDGLPNLVEDKSITIETGFTGSMVGMTTSPANGETNVTTELWEITVSFNGYPPHTFNVQLQRYFGGAWRSVYIRQGWQTGSTYFFYPDGSLWPNSSYRLVIKDVNANVTSTRAFTTGVDAPF